ncbi:MAG: gamma-glutamyl-gamma-aminobutyrate hydrolase family protein, partial [Anaerolineae bacterium]|nr:gamma-glutamyl-gamma-aminobutyrate hydrolase family protein [Anaerolineae bacterium]
DELPLDYPAHEVYVEPGSLLARTLGTTRVLTNSRHHQAVRTVGVGLSITGRAPDGLIEATEKPDAHFVLSVQWHPENMCKQDPAMRGLFESLVAAGRDYLRRKQNVTPA